MRKPKSNHGFLVCFLLNIFLNLEWSLPALTLLILHFVLDISIWWSVGALAAWLVIMLIITSIIKWSNNCSDIDAPKENKNPYSSGEYKPGGNTDKDE